MKRAPFPLCSATGPGSAGLIDLICTSSTLIWRCVGPAGGGTSANFCQEILISSKVVAPGLGGLDSVAFLSWTDDFAQNQAQILGNDVKEEMPTWGTHQIKVSSVANQPIQFSAIENPSEPGNCEMYFLVEAL